MNCRICGKPEPRGYTATFVWPEPNLCRECEAKQQRYTPFVTEESDNVTLVLLPTSRPCAKCETTVFAAYGISIDDTPFEPRCRKHLPENIIIEYWVRRMLLAAQEGNEKKARSMLRHITAEARINGYERCASIADVVAQDARNSYSDKTMAHVAEDAAKQVARAIRTAEEM